MYILLAFPIATGVMVGMLYSYIAAYKRNLTHCRHCDHVVTQ